MGEGLTTTQVTYVEQARALNPPRSWRLIAHDLGLPRRTLRRWLESPPSRSARQPLDFDDKHREKVRSALDAGWTYEELARALCVDPDALRRNFDPAYRRRRNRAAAESGVRARVGSPGSAQPLYDARVNGPTSHGPFGDPSPARLALARRLEEM